jgi:hypothetical protein
MKGFYFHEQSPNQLVVFREPEDINQVSCLVGMTQRGKILDSAEAPVGRLEGTSFSFAGMIRIRFQGSFLRRTKKAPHP